MPGGVPTVLGRPGAGPRGLGSFAKPFSQPTRYSISGITKDSTGAVLGLCTVKVFDLQSNTHRATIVSGANGVYSIDVTSQRGLTFFVVAYKAGVPDVAGTTVNTLTALPS